MPEEYLKGRTKNRNPDGSWTGKGDPSEGLTRKPDKTPEELKDERDGAIDSGKNYAEKFGEYNEKLKEWSDKKKLFNEKHGRSLAPKGTKLPNFTDKKPTPKGLAADVAWWILNPPAEPDTNASGWEMPPYPKQPLDPPYPKRPSICGMGSIFMHGVTYRPGMPTTIDEYRVFMTDGRDVNLYNWEELETVGTFTQFNTAESPNKPPKRLWGIAGEKNKTTQFYATFTELRKEQAYWSQAVGTWPGTKTKFVSDVKMSFIKPPRPDGFDGYYGVSSRGGSPYVSPDFQAWLGNLIPWSQKVCSIEIIYDEPRNVPDNENPNDYNREGDGMGCQWQKDEISYELPKLKIGEAEVGGNTISIDDGLLPLAQYLCKAVEMMHRGIGLDLLDKTELPVSLMNQGGSKVKHKSMAELSQWQFDNVSSLVGLPVKNTITNIDNETKDLQFKNIQDCLSYLVHQQRESDLDLMVIEQYSTKIAQQLEAVTQIALRQQSDIEMIIQELGFKFKWETQTRPCLYKTGMKDDDEVTGILELFKGGSVSYPVRKWDDELDQRQIALRTNLYAEIAAKAYLQPKNSKDEISGLDARIKMGKADKENWLEWVRTINTPEKGVVSGSTTPFIEEYDKGTLVAKAVKTPASGLSLFMKPVKPKKTT